MLDKLPILNRFRAKAEAGAPLFARLRQFCTVVDDFEVTVGNLVETLGIGPFRCFHFRPPVLYDTTFRGRPAEWTMKLAITWLDYVQWEVIRPMEGASLYREHLEARGPGVQHLLMDSGPVPFEEARDRLAAIGHPFAQTARANPAVRIGRVALPKIPNRVAPPVSLHFGYLDLERELGASIEMTRYPLGFSERFALRAGRADFCIPDGDSHFERPLPNRRVRRAVKASIVTRDLERTARAWGAIGGVRRWHLFDRPAARVAWALVDDALIELVQPGEAGGPHRELLAGRGEAVAAIGVEPIGPYDDFLKHCAKLGWGVRHDQERPAGEAAWIGARRSIGTDLEALDLQGEAVEALFRRAKPDRVLGG
jgi:methylmalonyl-CoA/ethylmalonyl-CoA epimerase